MSYRVPHLQLVSLVVTLSIAREYLGKGYIKKEKVKVGIGKKGSTKAHLLAFWKRQSSASRRCIRRTSHPEDDVRGVASIARRIIS